MPLTAFPFGARPTGFGLLFRALLLGSHPSPPRFNGFSSGASLRQAEDQARRSRIQAEVKRRHSPCDLPLTQVEPVAILGRES
jgi:hypothetical protein